MVAHGAEEIPVGIQLRRLRAVAGLTQEELAERASLTAKGIAAIERGRSRHPFPQTLRAIADALGLAGEQRARFLGAALDDDLLGCDPAPAQPHEASDPCRRLPEAPPTTLLGRADAVTTVAGLLLDGVRLVTLTGPGGVGKTRLALAVAARAADGFPDGVAFVPLAALADAELIVPALARALGVRESANRSQRDALHAWLQGRHFLLVLDNLEHLLAAAPEIAELLATSPGLTILATSRAPLRLQGEHEWAVPPLALPREPESPSLQHMPSPATLAAADLASPTARPEQPRRAIVESPAVRLFVERARAVDPTFRLTGANAEDVAAICRRLDGLPLALELAAARVRVLPPSALLARLDATLPLLVGGARDLPARQRTMRDTITWSYNLLTPTERSLFRRLAPFAGGWTLDAAEDVWDEGRPKSGAPPEGAATGEQPSTEPPSVLDLLSGLVEQSLVVRVADADGMGVRYRMLEPIRQYAVEILVESGEDGAARDRHAAHFLALAERAAPELFHSSQGYWLDRLAAEADNLRAALEWFLARGRPDEAVRLGWAVHRAWWVRGHLAEWRRWRAAILPHCATLARAARVRALITSACLSYAEGDHEGASALADECLPLAREEGDRLLLVRTLGLAGHASLGRGDTARARVWLTESLALAEGIGDRWAIGTLRNGLGYAALMDGELAQAECLLARAEAPLREWGAIWNLGMNLCMRSAIAAWEEDYQRVDRLARASLAHLAPLRDTWVIAYPLAQLAGVALAHGQAERAARLLGAADALRDAVGVPIFFLSDRTLRERYLAAARAQLEPGAFAAAWSAGRAAALEQVVAEILAEDRENGEAPPLPVDAADSLSAAAGA
jgi:predicted ATPase/transcriptional regulator with XRE-family HTH domain